MPSPPKTCPTCSTQVKSFSKSPSTCTNPKSNSSIQHLEENNKKACNECWEAYLSFEIERFRPPTRTPQGKETSLIECLFCYSHLSKSELKRLCRKDTYLRYEMKLQNATRRKCQNRCQGIEAPYQDITGRVFTCNICSLATCINCDVPEHPPNQSCSDYQLQLKKDLMHQTAEHLTSENYRRCPNCNIPFTMEKGCGYVQCVIAQAGIFGGCGFRFCAKCLIPWVGEGSDYLCGKTMHGEGCRYSRKEKPSMYSLKRRFEVPARSDGKSGDGGSSMEGESWDFSEKKLKVEMEPVVKIEGKGVDEECWDFSEQKSKVEPVVKPKGKDVDEGSECWEQKLKVETLVKTEEP